MFIGVYPKPMLDRIQPSVDRLIAHVQDKTDYVEPPVGVGQRERLTSCWPRPPLRSSGPTVQWYSLAPLITLVGGGLVLMVLSALLPGRWPRGGYAIFTAVVAGIAATFTILLWHDVQDNGPKSLVGGAIGLDGFSLFLTFVICVAVFISALFLDDYLRRVELDGAEVYALMLMSASGGVIMASANDLIVLFLGFEALSLALYVMAASQLRRIESQESGMKYFVLGGFSSAFLLYGIALVYGATGSTNLTKIVDFLDKNVLFENGLLLAGIALLLVGLAFKVAAVPFHTWTPDVYQGAPTPVTGFMASAAKAAAFAALIRVDRRRLRLLRERLAAGDLGPRRDHGARRGDPGRRPDQREAHAGLLLDQPRRLHPGRGRRGRAAGRQRRQPGHGGRALLPARLRRDGARHLRRRHAGVAGARRGPVARGVPRPRPAPGPCWRWRSRSSSSPRPGCR